MEPELLVKTTILKEILSYIVYERAAGRNYLSCNSFIESMNYA